MQKIKLKTEESGKKLLEAYAPPKWSETADDLNRSVKLLILKLNILFQLHIYHLYIRLLNLFV